MTSIPNRTIDHDPPPDADSSLNEATASDRAVQAPVRFEDAERINPYQLLIDLHDHARDHYLAPNRDDILTELALVAAVVSWCSRWQPMTIHAALRAGADLADIAAAPGLDPAEVVLRWERWAGVQPELMIGGRPAEDPDEVQDIRRRLGRGTDG